MTKLKKLEVKEISGLLSKFTQRAHDDTERPLEEIMQPTCPGGPGEHDYFGGEGMTQAELSFPHKSVKVFSSPSFPLNETPSNQFWKMFQAEWQGALYDGVYNQEHCVFTSVLQRSGTSRIYRNIYQEN